MAVTWFLVRELVCVSLVWPYFCVLFLAMRAPSLPLPWPRCDRPGAELASDLRLSTPHRWPHPLWCALLAPLAGLQLCLAVLGAPLLCLERHRYLDELEELPKHNFVHVPGGITHGWRTMLYSLYLRFIVRADCRNYKPLERAAANSLTACFLTDLPARPGNRPCVRPGLPQRQVSQVPCSAAREGTCSEVFGASGLFCAFDFVRCGPSKLEGSGAFGACCTCRCRPEVSSLQGELAYEHRVDGSWHVVLAPADALLVCRRGWAERGPPVVCQGIGPVGWIFLYAPRDKSEVAIVRAILRAAVSFAVS